MGKWCIYILSKLIDVFLLMESTIAIKAMNMYNANKIHRAEQNYILLYSLLIHDSLLYVNLLLMSLE